MTLSVRLEPDLEARIEQEAKRLGISKSDFVKDALERTLGIKNPAELLDKVRTGTPGNDPALSENASTKIKQNSRAKHSR